MKKSKTLFLFLSLIILLSSCSLDPREDNGGNADSWNTGTIGLVMNFVADHPRSIIRGKNLDVVIEYQNEGAYDIDNLIFYLHGYDSTILYGTPLKTFNAEPLKGKSQLNPQGSQSQFADFGETTINSPKGDSAYQQPLFVTACYNYKAIAEPSICINMDESDYKTVTSGGCEHGSVTGLTKSQGAPIIVSAVNSYVEDDVVAMDITIQNKGSGTPFTSTLNRCDRLSVEDSDTVRVKVSMNDGEFKCESSNGKIYLDDSGTGIVHCERTISREGYFVTPLKIEVDYNYEQTLKKTITIER